ncbi:MAG: MmgE/PrpD family protein [Rhizobiaceae bacterium]
MGRVTESLAQFVASAPEIPLPTGVEEIASVGFRDAIGVTLAGMNEPIWHRLKGLALEAGGARESRLFLSGDRVPANTAAMVGASTAHALDYDDYAFSNHVSAVLVPAILAEAEHVGANGLEMVRAYAVGYEVWRNIMKREPDDLYVRGWHPTAVFGGFATAAASACLHRADAETVKDAIGLVVAFGGGVMGNFGSMGKPVQGGQAAETGVRAVRMALAGIDAGADALDGDNGLLLALSPEGNVNVSDPAVGLDRFEGILSERLNIKRYPTVGASQRCGDAAVQLHRDLVPDLDRIGKIRPKVSERHARVMPMHKPASALEAKFSLEFVVAAGLISGRVGLNELSDEFVQRDDVQRLIDLVEIEIGPDDDPVYPSGGRADIIHLDLDDGTTISSDEVTRWRGHAERPMSEEELRDKFLDCAGQAIQSGVAEALFDQLADLGNLTGTGDLPILTLP